MSQITTHFQTAADDQLERYFAEKFWAMIPEIYRDEDRKSPQNGALRGLVETFASQAAEQRRSIDRLWEDAFIDTADDWAVPYIGSLFGTRMLSVLNSRGRRVDVAKTIAYRLRNGTPWLMEELIHDITGWHGAITEGFALLGRHPHNYDGDPAYSSGRAPEQAGYYSTRRAGTANLRKARNSDAINMAFDPFYHRPDMRRAAVRAGGEMKSSRGMQNLNRLNFHLYRQKPYRILNSTLYRFDNKTFCLDPSGREIALFSEGRRPFSKPEITSQLTLEQTARWTAPREWELPQPIQCRLLNAAQFAPTITDIPANDFKPMMGEYYETSSQFRAHYLRLMPGGFNAQTFKTFVEASITPDSPKLNLYGPDDSLYVGYGDDVDLSVSAQSLPNIAGAALSDQNGNPVISNGFLPELNMAIDPRTGRIVIKPSAPAANRAYGYRYHYGGFDDLGAGSYFRDREAYDGLQDIPELWRNTDELIMGDAADLQTTLNTAIGPSFFEFEGNKTTRLSLAGNQLLIGDTVLTGEDNSRPFVRLEPSGSQIVTIKAKVTPPGEARPCLTLDGLWVGLRPPVAASGGSPNLVNMKNEALPASSDVWTLILDGEFDKVRLKNVTLDPGGEAMRYLTGTPRHIPAVKLEIKGYVRELKIENSITGPIAESVSFNDLGGGALPPDPCSVGDIIIYDSLIDGQLSLHAISTITGSVHLSRCTVLGSVHVNRLYATETLIDGVVVASDTSHGCFRFSACSNSAPPVEIVPESDIIAPAISQVPNPFESHLYPNGLPADTFVSKRFGDAGYGQLSLMADPVILRGAENTSEMGVFSRIHSPILFADLRAKIDEYKPLNIIPQFIFET